MKEREKKTYLTNGGVGGKLASTARISRWFFTQPWGGGENRGKERGRMRIQPQKDGFGGRVI